MRFFGKLRLENEGANLNFKGYGEVEEEQKDAIEFSFILSSFEENND